MNHPFTHKKIHVLYLYKTPEQRNKSRTICICHYKHKTLYLLLSENTIPRDINTSSLTVLFHHNSIDLEKKLIKMALSFFKALSRQCRLQVVQEVIQVHVRFLVNALTNQEGQFVGVLTWCWYSDDTLKIKKKQKHKEYVR